MVKEIPRPKMLTSYESEARRRKDVRIAIVYKTKNMVNFCCANETNIVIAIKKGDTGDLFTNRLRTRIET